MFLRTRPRFPVPFMCGNRTGTHITFVGKIKVTGTEGWVTR